MTIRESGQAYPGTHLGSLISDFTEMLLFQSGIIGLLSVFPIIDGIFALRKKHFLFALSFSPGMLPIGFPYGGGGYRNNCVCTTHAVKNEFKDIDSNLEHSN